MTTEQQPQPFSNPAAVTWSDDCVRVTGGKPGEMRHFRIVADLDQGVYALFIRDKAGKLPESPNYVTHCRYFAKYWAKGLAPHEADKGVPSAAAAATN